MTEHTEKQKDQEGKEEGGSMEWEWTAEAGVSPAWIASSV